VPSSGLVPSSGAAAACVLLLLLLLRVCHPTQRLSDRRSRSAGHHRRHGRCTSDSATRDADIARSHTTRAAASVNARPRAGMPVPVVPTAGAGGAAPGAAAV